MRRSRAFGVQARVPFLQEFRDLLIAHPQLRGLGEQRVDGFRQGAGALVAGQFSRALCHIGAGTVALRQLTGTFQFHIGASHGVGIDEQLLGQRSDAGKFRFGRQMTRGDQITDLIDELAINWDPR